MRTVLIIIGGLTMAAIIASLVASQFVLDLAYKLLGG